MKHILNIIVLFFLLGVAIPAQAWKCHHRCPSCFAGCGEWECKAWKRLNCGGSKSGTDPSNPGTGTINVYTARVCLYNETGHKLNYRVEWDTCNDTSGSVSTGHHSIITCPNKDTATLALTWEGYKTIRFRFPSTPTWNRRGQDRCVNSLTVKPTKFGYEWNVYAGKP